MGQCTFWYPRDRLLSYKAARPYFGTLESMPDLDILLSIHPNLLRLTIDIGKYLLYTTDPRVCVSISTLVLSTALFLPLIQTLFQSLAANRA